MGFFSNLIKLGDPFGIDPINKAVSGRLGGGGGGGGTLADQYGADAFSELDKIHPNFRRSYDSAGGAKGLGGRSFEKFLTDHFKAHPEDQEVRDATQALQGFAETGRMLWPGEGEGLVPVYDDGTVGGDPEQPADVPAEQGLYNLAMPGLLDDINRDAGRRDLAKTLGTQLTTDTNAARGTLESALGPTFDSESYFAANPDVAAAYAQSDKSQTPTQFAQNHYESYGKNEGRQGAYTTLLQRDNANADRTAASMSGAAQLSAQQQLEALAHYATEMKGNLSGELQQRAEALEAQIKALGANLDQYDDAQKAALAKQIEESGHALETAIKSQQDNLSTQIQTLREANTAQGQARLASLQQESESLRNANTAQGQARKAALDTEITQLKEASTAQGQARLTALTQEMDKLTAAQEPVAQARLAGANNATTAVNIGLQRQQDLITAQQADNGYIGGSTLTDAAAIRATIDARQKAAQIMSDAREKNALDTRDVATHGATTERSIAEALAADRSAISGRSATEGRTIADQISGNESAIAGRNATETRGINDDVTQGTAAITAQGAAGTRTLADALATGKQQISDFGSSQTRTNANNVATTRLNIGNTGATTKYNDALYGGSEGRKIGDALTTGTLGVNTALAQQQQAAANAAAAAKSSYYDANYQRQLGSALQLPSLTNNLTNGLTNLDNFGNSGLTRSLNTLNWWSGGGQAPTPGYVPVNPTQTGSDMAGLGAGLVGSAINIGNANKWWQSPIKPGVNPPAGSTNFNYTANGNAYTTPIYDAGAGIDYSRVGATS